MNVKTSCATRRSYPAFSTLLGRQARSFRRGQVPPETAITKYRLRNRRCTLGRRFDKLSDDLMLVMECQTGRHQVEVVSTTTSDKPKVYLL